MSGSLKMICPIAAMLLLSEKSIFPQAVFSASDTICITDSVLINNLSRDASTYYWNFCSGNLGYEPQGRNLSNQGTLNGPAFIDFAETDDGIFAFITNHTDGTLTRNHYGQDFFSVPVSKNLGNFGGAIPAHVQGVQVIEDNGNWYVFVVGGQREESRLVRLAFGNSLDNDPVVTNFGNTGDMDYPGDLYMVFDLGNWYGFTVNYNSNTITRFSFGSSPANVPVSTNLGNPGGLNQPSGIIPVFEDGWYFFISNYANHEIIRLDFGNSLINVPTGYSIGDSEYLYYPFDLTILRDCGHIFGFVLNRFGDVVRLDFEMGIEEQPTFTSLGETGDLYNPQGISDVLRIGDTLYTFVANAGNSSITLLFFPGCDNAFVDYSEQRDPPAVMYDTPGKYNISLVIDEGMPTQENFCKEVVVLESPELDLGNDTTMTPGTTILLDAGDFFEEYDWSTGDETRTSEIDAPGTYALEITNEHGCKASDQIEVIMDIGIPNFFTPNGDGYNDTWSIPFLRSVPDAEIMVFDRFGNLIISYRASEGGWDGTSNGNAVPPNTYWYVIKMPGNHKPYKGSITIKR
jgi:gliding motility-associated-like protein